VNRMKCLGHFKSKVFGNNMKYFRRLQFGQPEEITWESFVAGVQGEFMYGKNYYEHMFVLFGMGQKLIGSRYMYWIDKE